MTQYVGTVSFNQPRFLGEVRAEQPHLFTGSLRGTGYFGSSIEARIPVKAERSLLGKGVFTGSITYSHRVPYGAFRDFSHYADTMADPAMVLVSAEASGLTTFDATAPSQMRRVWVSVAAPREYPTKTEPNAWPRAAFASVGVRVNAMANNTYQYVDGAQVEVAPLSQNGPTAYAPARALNIKVRPDRLNYCVNPGFTNDLTGWGHLGTGVTGVWDTGRDRIDFASVLPTGVGFLYPAVPVPARSGSLWSGSMEVTVPVGYPTVTLRGSIRAINSGGVSIAETYDKDVTIQPGETKTVILGDGTTPLPADAVGVRPTLQPAVPIPAGARVLVDNVLFEATPRPGPFFHGSMGEDYLWEGTEEASRSYYYRDRLARAYLLDRLLKENCPLGVIPAVPQFAVLPSE